MYEALYRKYRPRSFDEVVGQEHITETLKAQVSRDRLSHAYLFIGTRGTGKTTCARILAKAVNCEHPVNGNPCNACPSCLGIDDGSILDVTELDAASNNGVDDVRMLRDEAVFSPTVLKKRVYIIDEVHMLSKPAFNALLKILEEPPEHLMFILATTELNKVLPTILSRCQRHSFRRLDAETVAGRLSWVAEQEGIRLLPDAAELLGRLADGGMRDGLSLLDQCASREVVDRETVLSAMGMAGSLLTGELAGLLAARDVPGALSLFRRLWQEGKDPASLLNELAGFFRDALMLQLAPGGGQALLSGLYSEESLTALPLESGSLLNALNIVQKYQAALKDAPSPRLPCELCLMELGGVRGSDSRPPEAPAKAPAPKRRPVPPPPPAPVREEAPPWEEEAPPPPTEADLPPWEEVPPIAPRQEAPPAPPAEPEREAETPPAESSPAPPAPAGEEQSWTEILERLRPVVHISKYSLLSDEFSVEGRQEGDSLILSVAPGFPMAMINDPKLLETISLCCGLRVRVEELHREQTLHEDKLDALGKFNNVTIQ